MKRSEINQVIRDSTSFFSKNGWTLPPEPRWDVTDFGLGDFKKSGLVLVNLAEEPEYCEKLMYGIKSQVTPAHCHKKKKEDIICRNGILSIQLWASEPGGPSEANATVKIKLNGKEKNLESGSVINIRSGERITIFPGVWHEFQPLSDECIIGEVSTANDDLNDNFFANKEIGRFSEIEEDEAPVIKLLSD